MGACLKAAREMKDEGSFAALGDAISFADVAAIMKGEKQA
jgi:hypothetical protein